MTRVVGGSRSRLPSLLLVAAGTSMASGCVTPTSTAPAPAADDVVAEQVLGRLGLVIEVAPGTATGIIHYQITGNAFLLAGDLNAADTASFSALVAGIPAGNGYTLALTSTGDAGVVCEGSAGFDIVAQVTTSSTVKLQCRSTPHEGTLLVRGTSNFCPMIAALNVQPAEAYVGKSVALLGVASDLDHGPKPLSFVWSGTSGTLLDPTSAASSLTCTAVGIATVTVSVSDGDCSDGLSADVRCLPAPETGTALVRINEVESNGGSPGDWVELYNAGTATANLAGWTFYDNDPTHAYLLPAGTTLGPGAFIVMEEAVFGFGLGASDSVRLDDAAGSLVDSYLWIAHASTSYGRCPDGTGELGPTAFPSKGTANACADAPDAGTDAGADAANEPAAIITHDSQGTAAGTAF